MQKHMMLIPAKPAGPAHSDPPYACRDQTLASRGLLSSFQSSIFSPYSNDPLFEDISVTFGPIATTRTTRHLSEFYKETEVCSRTDSPQKPTLPSFKQFTQLVAS